MKTNLNRLFFLILLSGLILIPGSAAFGFQGDYSGISEAIEKAILKASEMHEQGKIQKEQPYIEDISSDIKLTFAEESFDADVEKAFKLLDQVMAKKREGKAETTSSSANAKVDDRIGALMTSEKKTNTGIPQAEQKVPLEYSVYKNYQQARQERNLNEGKTEEADMQVVIAERQAAAQNLQRKREREQQLQAQATKWQDQMDKQASASARAAAAWEAEHSFGAYVKSFLGMAIQTSVGAFTGGLLGTVSTNLANKAVQKLFPNVDTNTLSQAAAAGTSSAITSTASDVGQSVGQGVTSSVTGQKKGQVPEPEY